MLLQDNFLKFDTWMQTVGALCWKQFLHFPWGSRCIHLHGTTPCGGIFMPSAENAKVMFCMNNNPMFVFGLMIISYCFSMLHPIV